MKHFLILLLFVISVGSTAQIKNFEFKAAANSSFINSATKNLSPVSLRPVDPASGYTSYTTNLGSIKESYESNVGFEVTSSFQAWEFKNFFLRSGLGIQYLRFHKKITMENQVQNLIITPGIFPGTDFQMGNPYGVIVGGIYPRDGNVQWLPAQGQLFETNPNLGKTTALYLQIPVSIGRTFFSDKLMVAANLQAQFLAHATVVKEEYLYSGMTEYKDKSADGFSNTLFLIGVESAYKIVKPISLSLAYNRSLTPIYDERSQVGGKTFFNNVSLGVNYSIGK